jgi:hypothetical protein
MSHSKRDPTRVKYCWALEGCKDSSCNFAHNPSEIKPMYCDYNNNCTRADCPFFHDKNRESWIEQKKIEYNECLAETNQYRSDIITAEIKKAFEESSPKNQISNKIVCSPINSTVRFKEGDLPWNMFICGMEYITALEKYKNNKKNLVIVLQTIEERTSFIMEHPVEANMMDIKKLEKRLETLRQKITHNETKRGWNISTEPSLNKPTNMKAFLLLIDEKMLGLSASVINIIEKNGKIYTKSTLQDFISEIGSILLNDELTPLQFYELGELIKLIND